MLEPGATRTVSKFALEVTLPLAVLVAVASLGGLLRPEPYELETEDWTTQSTAQDVVNLFLILPVFIIAGLFVRRGERLAEPIWGGSMLYLIYTFIIYCFSIHFNKLFLVYVASLGFSAWGFVYFIWHQQRRQTIQRLISVKVARVIGIYFVVIASVFYLLWLGEIVPSVWSGERPATLTSAGLPTNPVQVLDLSFFLPGIFLTGFLLFRNHTTGLMLAPVLLVFFVLMDITILVIFLAQHAAGAALNLVGVILIPALSLLSLAGLLWFLRNGEG